MFRRIICICLSLCMLGLFGCGKAQQATTSAPQLTQIPNQELRVLIGQLDTQSQANLCAMYEAASQFRTKAELPYPTTEEKVNILVAVLRYSCPELFQLDFTQPMSYTTLNGQVVELQLPLTLTQAEYETQYAACQAVIDQLIQQTQGMTDAQKEKYVYDYITNHCQYDAERKNAGTPYGCLVEGYAKCDGASLTMQWIMESMGIRCLTLAGEPVNGPIGHAWNTIELDGVFYDVDVTADLAKPNEDRSQLYPAYNVSRTWIRDQYYLDPGLSSWSQLPGTDSMDMSYHALNGDFIKKGQTPDLEERFLQAYQDESGFMLQFEAQEDYQTFLEQLETQINQIGSSNNLPGWAFRYCTVDSFRTVSLQVGKP